MPRKDRGPDQLRTVALLPNFTEHAEGSVLCSFGRTRVLCTASAEERVPSHVKGSGRGWVTAEYGMLLEVQGTAEKHPFTPSQLSAMVELAQKGLRELHARQSAALQEAFKK